MKYTVVTSFNEAGLKQYGQRMIDTFEQHWPAEVDLVVCAEHCQPRVSRTNTQVLDLVNLNSALVAFTERNKNNPRAHGLAGPPDVYDPRKTFRWHAQRFAYKVYSLALCERFLSDWMIWLDADTHTHTAVPMSWLEQISPQDAMITYLGRGEKYHSECGWVGYNLANPATRDFIHQFVAMYDQDRIFDEAEWHDSYIWDVVRKQYQANNTFFNLNPSWEDKGLAGHPFINSELGLYMDHVKGERKLQGMSRPKEVVMHQNHPYWQQVLRQKGKK